MVTMTPQLRELDHISSRTIEEIKNEPMLWSADIDYAWENGGPITREFISKLDQSKSWLIDTRVHMLMEGWFPCIGGWHLDNMPRDTENGQPNYKNPPHVASHTLAVVDAGTNSLTEFLTTPITLPEPPQGVVTYGFWSPLITKQLEEGKVQSRMIESGRLIEFDSYTFHRGVPASGKGWRFFVRATTDTPQPAKNEIRRQVNTYLPIEAGW